MNRTEQKNKTLLVVSPVPEICRRVRSALEGEGYRCITAPDGVTALGLLSQREVGMVLADTDAAGVGGVELLDQVAAHNPEAYVILMARPEEIPAIARETSVGASDFLSRPFTSEQIVARVRDA